MESKVAYMHTNADYLRIIVGGSIAGKNLKAKLFGIEHLKLMYCGISSLSTHNVYFTYSVR